MASALGYRFLDANNKLLEPIGKNLENIRDIDDTAIDPVIKDIEFDVACDVNNPLTGPEGAAWIYGPQKGASKEQLQKLDIGLRVLAKVVYKKFGEKINNVPGSGAAGGLGGGALIFLHAKLQRGIDLVLNYLNFEQLLSSCEFVITGEGKLDKQSLMGKAISGIMKKASICKVPVIVMAGIIDLTPEQLNQCAIHKAYCINPSGIQPEVAIVNARDNLRQTSCKMAFEILKARQIS